MFSYLSGVVTEHMISTDNKENGENNVNIKQQRTHFYRHRKRPWFFFAGFYCQLTCREGQ